jgi:dynein heavy chain, axonemal
MMLQMFINEHDDMPWDALLYTTGQINYGGRVTDDLDRRCLMSILERYYTRRVVNDDNYKFSPSGTYFAPGLGTHEECLSYIRQLPFSEEPEVFGMNENANIKFQLQETGRILETVLSIQPRLSSGGSGKSSEEIVDELANEIAEALPQVLRREEAGPTTLQLGPTGMMNSLATVLLHEMERFNKLLNVMRKTLIELKKAIKGLVVMSSELERMFGSFINNQVPELWAKAAYPSLKPLASWVKDLHRRVQFMRAWLTAGTPKCFWLPGFFFPQGVDPRCCR